MLLDRIVRGYLEHRADPTETFRQFVLRHTSESLKELFVVESKAAAAA
jgi:hypothetical protein